MTAQNSLSGDDSSTLLTEYGATNPPAPLSGIKLFARMKARRLPAIIGPSGQDTALQPSIFSNKISKVNAVMASTAPTLDGIAVTHINGTTAVPSAVSLATTNPFTAMVRYRCATQATAGTGAGTRSSATQWFLSSTANMGGFFFVARCGWPSTATIVGTRTFIGFNSSAAAFGPTVEPSVVTNMFGFGWDSTDSTSIYFMSNATAATATRVATQFSLQATQTMYEFRLFAPSGGGSLLYWSVQRLSDGVMSSGQTTTNLPALNTMLAAHIHYSNGTVAAGNNIDIQSLYIESDN